MICKAPSSTHPERKREKEKEKKDATHPFTNKTHVQNTQKPSPLFPLAQNSKTHPSGQQSTHPFHSLNLDHPSRFRRRSRTVLDSGNDGLHSHIGPSLFIAALSRRPTGERRPSISVRFLVSSNDALPSLSRSQE
ncbi:unnamed protein product [Lactuca virosa]|uniref:Uncharacterized protein n=1 Tax=Lactuca virosa TaxID=75947 RepID=A0AAU9LU90_9ASTR|nr:unnamed protein product [Lactuca virosa]